VENGAQRVLTGLAPIATQAAHTCAQRLFAGAFPTIFETCATLSQIHSLYQDYELLIS
jgi:hypothetical protein